MKFQVTVCTDSFQFLCIEGRDGRKDGAWERRRGEGEGKGYRFTESRAEVASIYVSLSLNSLACRRHGQCPAMRTLVRLRDVVITVARLLTQVATDHLGGMAKRTQLCRWFVCLAFLPLSQSHVPLYGHTALWEMQHPVCVRVECHHSHARTPLVPCVGWVMWINKGRLNSIWFSASVPTHLRMYIHT